MSRKILLSLVLVINASLANAAPVVVTTQNDFNTQIGSTPIVTETFPVFPIPDPPDVGTNPDTLNLSTGIVSTVTNFNTNLESHAILEDTAFGDGLGELFAFLTAPSTVTLTLPFESTGFFGHFESVLEMQVAIGNNDVFGNFVDFSDVLGVVNGGTNGTLGIVDTMSPFTQIRYRIQPGQSLGAFSINSLQVAAVPTPSAILLMGSGLVGIVGWRWWSTKHS